MSSLTGRMYYYGNKGTASYNECIMLEDKKIFITYKEGVEHCEINHVDNWNTYEILHEMPLNKEILQKLKDFMKQQTDLFAKTIWLAEKIIKTEEERTGVSVRLCVYCLAQGSRYVRTSSSFCFGCGKEGRPFKPIENDKGYKHVSKWSVGDVLVWARQEALLSDEKLDYIIKEEINGSKLLEGNLVNDDVLADLQWH